MIDLSVKSCPECNKENYYYDENLQVDPFLRDNLI